MSRCYVGHMHAAQMLGTLSTTLTAQTIPVTSATFIKFMHVGPQ